MPRVIHVFRQPERFVAGTVGEPGDRSFYLQAIQEARTVSVLLEKQQVTVLAERITALLQEVARRFGSDAPEGAGDPGHVGFSSAMRLCPQAGRGVFQTRTSRMSCSVTMSSAFATL